MKLLLRLIVNAVAVLVTAYLLPGVTVDSFLTALVVAIVLALVNTFLRPILLLVTLPLNFITLGLFTFILNALLILLVASLVTGFVVSGFVAALLFSLILAIVSGVLHLITRT